MTLKLFEHQNISLLKGYNSDDIFVQELEAPKWRTKGCETETVKMSLIGCTDSVALSL